MRSSSRKRSLRGRTGRLTSSRDQSRGSSRRTYIAVTVTAGYTAARRRSSSRGSSGALAPAGASATAAGPTGAGFLQIAGRSDRLGDLHVLAVVDDRRPPPRPASAVAPPRRRPLAAHRRRAVGGAVPRGVRLESASRSRTRSRRWASRRATRATTSSTATPTASSAAPSSPSAAPTAASTLNALTSYENTVCKGGALGQPGVVDPEHGRHARVVHARPQPVQARPHRRRDGATCRRSASPSSPEHVIRRCRSAIPRARASAPPPTCRGCRRRAGAALADEGARRPSPAPRKRRSRGRASDVPRRSSRSTSRSSARGCTRPQRRLPICRRPS